MDLSVFLENPFYVGIGIAVLIVLLIVLLAALISFVSDEENTPWKRAGRRGEAKAEALISKVLKESDILLSNIVIETEDGETELDQVVINETGVHIIEVKNYVGTLFGDEEDSAWKKVKVTRAGNEYVKNVRNPIKQVKRQIYLLANYLRDNGINVWVTGYVFLTEFNSPVHNEYILDSLYDINNALHAPDRQHLDEDLIKRILDLL